MTTHSLDPLELDLEPERGTGPGRRDLMVVGAAAIGFDLAVRSGIACLAGALLVLVVAVGLFATGRLQNPQARAAAAAAPAFGFFLAWRNSPWLVVPDIVAAGGLLLVAASFARGGSMADLSVPRIVARAVRTIGHCLAAPAHLVAAVGSLGRPSSAWAAVLRGAVLALPLVFVLALLLSSADAVFASFFDVALDPGSMWAHLVLGAMGAWGMAALLGSAWDDRTEAPSTGRARRLGTVESSVVLGALVALYAAFTVAQLVAVSEGGKRVLETAGLTYAEYARSGFFQLLAVAAITFVVLLVLDNGERTVRMLAGAAVVLTLGIVGVALRRLGLYEQAFGLTMLRLYSMVFAVWIGAVFVLLGCRLAGLDRTREWLLPAAAGLGLAMLFALNVLNPEALVVKRNDDPSYNASLSTDVVPTLVERGFHEEVCPPASAGFDGWAAWNRSEARAEAACRGARAQD